VNKSSCKKASSHVNKIGTYVGEREMCEMWKDHVKSLYNSVPEGGARSKFHQNCVMWMMLIVILQLQILPMLSALRVKVKVLDLMDYLWSLYVFYLCMP